MCHVGITAAPEALAYGWRTLVHLHVMRMWIPAIVAMSCVDYIPYRANRWNTRFAPLRFRWWALAYLVTKILTTAWAVIAGSTGRRTAQDHGHRPDTNRTASHEI